jgi:hypothetical protein
LLFFAEDDFALANELIVQPKAVFVGGALEADAWRAAQQAHTCRGLKNIGGKGAAVDVKLDAKIAGVGDPGDLIPGVEYDDLGYESDEYGTLCHGFPAPCLIPAASSAPRRFFRIGREEIPRSARNDGIRRVREKSDKLLQTDDSTSETRVPHATRSLRRSGEQRTLVCNSALTANLSFGTS